MRYIALMLVVITIIVPVSAEEKKGNDSVGRLLNAGAKRLQARFAEADRLWEAKKYTESLAELDRLQNELPANARLSRWEIDFRGAEIKPVVTGKRHVYFLHYNLGRKNVLPRINPNNFTSDWRNTVHCAEIGTGKILWSRRFMGLAKMGVDPKTDNLYMLGQKVLELDAKSGAVKTEHKLPNEGRGITGLILGSRMITPRPEALMRHGLLCNIKLYNPRSRSVQKIDIRARRFMSPDESKRLERNNDGWLVCVTQNKNKKLWRFDQARMGWETNSPFWFGGDVLWLAGTGCRKGQVIRMGGEKGKPRWTTTLPYGAYNPATYQLDGEGYWGNWNALSIMDSKHLLAIGGRGRLFFLNPGDGRILASAHPCTQHSCAPMLVGDTLVVYSSRGIRAIPVNMLIGKSSLDERHVLTRKARCLRSMGKAKKALDLLDYLIERDPDFAEAWAERVAVCGALGLNVEEVYSRCRHLALSGKIEDPVLRDRWGLLRLIRLRSRLSWQIHQVGPIAYVGTQTGELWGIDVRTLVAERVATVTNEIHGLRKLALLRTIDNSSTCIRRDVSLPNNPDQIEKVGGRQYYVSSYDGRVVRYRGKYYSSRGGGKVRVRDGQEVVEYTSNLKGIKSWRIHLTPTGPIGYGTGGVYELDQNLCPIRRIIEPRIQGKKPKLLKVSFLRTTGRSIGMVVSSSEGAALQVYTRDGGKLLKEVSLGRYITGWVQPDQFIVLRDGYLFSDRQLTWVGPDWDRQAWQFGPPIGQTRTSRWGDRWQFFGEPLLTNGYLFVSGLDGCVYIFDPVRMDKQRRKTITK